MQTGDEVTLVNTSLPYFTGIPEDVVVNTWHFIFDYGGSGLPSVSNYGELFDALKAFYDAVYASVARGSWVGNVMTMKAYSLWLMPPHVPVFSGTRTIAGTGAAGSAPTETAVCLSYKATYIGGVPQARQRGRIFLGGFSSPVAAGGAALFPEVPASLRTAIATAAAALRTTLLSKTWTWVVLSPTQVQAGGQETFPVTSGWIDNAPDTQRRRGQTATARTAW